MAFPTEDVIKILIAFFAGAILGIERETNRKPAGLRTIILITVGSTLYSILSISLINSTYDRIASNIVTGVGFVGGGVIFKEGATLKGITTAATIWAAAAIGMAIGFGKYWLAGSTVIVTLVALWLLAVVEDKVQDNRIKKIYSITFNRLSYSAATLKVRLESLGIDARQKKMMKEEDDVTVDLLVFVNSAEGDKLDNFLVNEAGVKKFEV